MQNNNFNINDDDFVIGKGFSVEETEQKQKKKRNGKKNSTLKNIIWIVSIFVVSAALGATIVFSLFDYVGMGFGRGETVQMEIPQGASTTVIAEKLEESGAVKMPFIFKLYSKTG